MFPSAPRVSTQSAALMLPSPSAQLRYTTFDEVVFKRILYLVSLQRAFTNHNVSPTFTNHNITNMIYHTRYTPVQPGSPS